jgi:hypothetical protein
MKYILLSILLLTGVTLSAAPVSQAQAEQAARNWTSVWAPQAESVRSIQSRIPLSLNNETQMYLFEYADGFVVIASDDAVYPVLAYGFDTVVNGMDSNPAFRDFLQEMMQEIVQVKANNTDNSETAARWQDVLNNNITRHGTRSINRWNQGWPYNMYCPEDAAGPGGHVYAGCVASAMAQVVKYWNWPVTGAGTHTYNAQDYGNQTANFGTTTYQWTQMPIQVNEPNDAVARLMYHLGVSVDMMYAPDGSGAYSQDVPEALVSHFLYDSGIQRYSKSNYPAETWEQMLRDELDNARPMYYSGSGPGGGHAFNCDGYQNNNYFHFNWGWGGSYDGYFYVSNLNPGYTFNNYQSAVFNILPQNYSISSVQMSLSGTDCSVGDLSTVSVMSYPILPAWNVISANFIVEFDETNMEYAGFLTTGTMLEGYDVSVSEIQPGRIAVSAATTSSLMGGGTLLKLQFQPMVPGEYVFNLAEFSLNSTIVPLLAPATINVTAEVSDLQNSVIDILNAMHIPYNEITTMPLTTTFVLPNWNVTTASFIMQYPMELVAWEGYEIADCLAENAVIEVDTEVPGQIMFSLGFSENLVGSGNLLKFRFRAIGNVGFVSLATITISNFYYNQTLISNVQPGYIVLLPITANDDGAAVPENRLAIGPNPFSALANLSLQLIKANQDVTADIYNLKGQLVRKLYAAELKGTQLNLQWNGEDGNDKQVPAGMYLVRIKSSDWSCAEKLIKLK